MFLCLKGGWISPYATMQDYSMKQDLDCALEKEKSSEMKDSKWEIQKKKKKQQAQFEWRLLHKLSDRVERNLTKNTGDNTKDEEQVLLLLASLPKSFKWVFIF